MSTPDQPSTLEPGVRVDRYELLYAVAQGGMGSVWAARLQGKHGFEKLHAIKTILPQYAAEPEFRTMFLDEAKLASAITHPNVVQNLDLGEHQGMLYTVMEWVEGDALNRIARDFEKTGQRIPHGILLRILADTCAGLHAAHELTDPEGRAYELVHRDVSPQNILVTLTGVAKLIDFGVAKARDRLSEETATGVMKGKIRYIAPEQAMGLPIDRRADIWSMGAVMYLLLTGESPFEGDTEIAILRRLISGEPPRPVPATIPRPIAAVVEGCLQMRASDRYATAIHLQRALESAMIEAGIACTAADVSVFVTENTKTRVAARRKSLQFALAAVEERVRVRELLERRLHGEGTGNTALPIERPMMQLGRERGDEPPSVPTTAGTTLERTDALGQKQVLAGSSRRSTLLVAGASFALVIAAAIGIFGVRFALRQPAPQGAIGAERPTSEVMAPTTRVPTQEAATQAETKPATSAVPTAVSSSTIEPPVASAHTAPATSHVPHAATKPRTKQGTRGSLGDTIDSRK